MPSHFGRRPLKAWRYVGVFGPELMLCAAQVRVGRARQSFWALWDRRERSLYEHTAVGGAGDIVLTRGRLSVYDRSVRVELELREEPGVEAVSSAGAGYAWTRKQGGVAAEGVAELRGRRVPVAARAIIDDTAAYYPRHTSWRWCAGVGVGLDGSELAWNFVSGVGDPPQNSERTLWVDGDPREVPPNAFSPQLERVDGLSFHAEAQRARRENLLLIRSTYSQPFGTFSGRLAEGLELHEGYGVMEAHEAWW